MLYPYGPASSDLVHSMRIIRAGMSPGRNGGCGGLAGHAGSEYLRPACQQPWTGGS